MQNLLGSDLYTMVSQLLLGFKMDMTLFYQLLGLAQYDRELERPWVLLRSVDTSQRVSPTQNNITNSLYLTPLDLPTDFLATYSPLRTIILVSQDGQTFRYYSQIPMSRRNEYKDDNSKFYIDFKNKKYYLCGTLDQTYTVNFHYVASTDSIAAKTSWAFPPQFQPILAYDVAKTYREDFDYDVTNVAQGQMIEASARRILASMLKWDDVMQQSELEGVDYPTDNGRGTFNSNVVGDNDSYGY